MKKFSNTFACLSGVHCVVCRSDCEKGDAFRSEKLALFDEDIAECPYGKPMGFQWPDDIAERKEANRIAGLACSMRGEKVDIDTCKTCKGNIEIDVYECTKHSFCTINRSGSKEYKCCGLCPDRDMKRG